MKYKIFTCFPVSLICFALLVSSLNASESPFRFVNKSKSMFAGTTCISKNPFDRIFIQWGDSVYLMNADHNPNNPPKSTRQHCMWKLNSDGTSLGYHPEFTKLLNTLPKGGNSFGWGIEASDLDGDSQNQMEITGQTNGYEAQDGYFKFDIIKDTLRWKSSAAWVVCQDSRPDANPSNAGNKFLYDANLNRKIDPGARECINKERFFDSDGDGQPNVVESPWGKEQCGRTAMQAYGDLDNDGDTDMFCHTVELSEDNLHIAVNDGDGNFTVIKGPKPSHQGNGDGWFKSSRGVLDFDNNGYADYFSCSNEAGCIWWMNIDGTVNNMVAKSMKDLDDVDGQPYGWGRRGIGVWDWDNDCDIDVAVSTRPGQLPGLVENNLYLGENQVGGNCIKVKAQPWDRIIVRRKSDNTIVFSQEYVIRYGITQTYGLFHVGLGKLTPKDVKCEIDSIYSSANTPCEIK